LLEAEEEEEEGSPSPQKVRQQFNEEAYLKKWDEDNEKIHIPKEVVDYIDNDFDLEYDDGAGGQ
jgi:hypothetical protein